MVNMIVSLLSLMVVIIMMTNKLVDAVPVNATKSFASVSIVQPTNTTSAPLILKETIIAASAINFDAMQYFDDWDRARSGDEYASAGPLQKRGLHLVHAHDLMHGYSMVPKCIVEKYPALKEDGVSVGMRVTKKKSLYWPDECKCYKMDGGRVWYHIPTRLVTGCAWVAEC